MTLREEVELVGVASASRQDAGAPIGSGWVHPIQPAIAQVKGNQPVHQPQRLTPHFRSAVFP